MCGCWYNLEYFWGYLPVESPNCLHTHTHTHHHTNIKIFPTLFFYVSPLSLFLILNNLIILSPFQHSQLLLFFFFLILSCSWKKFLLLIICTPHPPAYWQGIHSKTPSSCLKLWMLLKLICTVFFPIHVYYDYKLGTGRD